MIVDASAIISISKVEPEAATFIRALSAASVRTMSAATYLEVSMVLLGRRATSLAIFGDLDRLMARSRIAVEPVTELDASAARDAFAKFGKGRHKAGLNFGDCFTYALARRLRRPILCKGNDYIHTDAQIVQLP